MARVLIVAPTVAEGTAYATAHGHPTNRTRIITRPAQLRGLTLELGDVLVSLAPSGSDLAAALAPVLATSP